MTFHIIISHIFPENFNLQFDHPQEGLRQLAYSACGTFTKKKERIQKFKETRDSQYIYQNEVNKACFQHDMAYGDFKDLNRRTATDKVIKCLILLKIQNMMDINVDLLQWSINFLLKKLLVVVLKMRIFQTKD